MEEGKVSDNSLTSAAAFVEGGIQDACDDACSICLEAFCDSDPSTVTGCKHEFHLQCILEWCQRSSQCPMCWQAISLKDPSSQELFDGVEHERNVRMNPPRNSTIFHHPTLGDFELQHLPVNATESELEERIIQHLAAAAAMGRARQIARREGQRNRSASTQGRQRFLVFSTHPNGTSAASATSDGSFPGPAVMIDGPNSPLVTVAEDSSQLIAQSSLSGPSAAANQYETSSSNRSPAQTSPGSQNRAGPSDLQSFSENLKTRLSSLSTRYKESITKSTRGWKERIFARNTSVTETPPSTETRRESSQSISTVSRLMDHLEIAEDGTRNVNNGLTANVTEEQYQTAEMNSGHPLGEDDSTRALCAAPAAAASSASN
ncbi:hypothetical protein CASFOL_040330 [Castilleja foliolosa]|uniref:RING-type E3 ubiquitin transferase n=1 Tax=Castilleja foliolosa TaxID=1961234 RepID=A0ABD3BG39_9LAMI